MKEIGLNNLRDLYKFKNTPKKKAFYSKLNFKLKEYGIYSSYFAYNITSCKEFDIKKLGERKKTELKSDLNQSILDSIYATIEAKAITRDIGYFDEKEWADFGILEADVQKDIDEEFERTQKYKCQAKDNYIVDAKEVAKTIISLKSRKQIKEKLNEKKQ